MPVLLFSGCEGYSTVAVGWGVSGYNCVGIGEARVDAVHDFRLCQESKADIGVIQHATCRGKAAVAATADVVRAEADIGTLVGSLTLALLGEEGL